MCIIIIIIIIIISRRHQDIAVLMTFLWTQKNFFLATKILKIHVISTVLAKEWTQMSLGSQ